MTEEQILKRREARKRWADAHSDYHKTWWKEKLKTDPDYHKKRWAGGKAKWNTDQRREQQKEWARKNRLLNPEKVKEANRRSRKNRFSRGKAYGITREVFDQMRLEQNNKCAICNAPFRMESDSNIDHSHTTGEVRGLLCQQCNAGLGMFGDSIQTCKNAVSYLSKFLSFSPLSFP